MMDLITGIGPIIVLIVFVGVMVYAAKSVALGIISVGVIALLLYDFVNEIRQSNGNT